MLFVCQSVKPGNGLKSPTSSWSTGRPTTTAATSTTSTRFSSAKRSGTRDSGTTASPLRSPGCRKTPSSSQGRRYENNFFSHGFFSDQTILNLEHLGIRTRYLQFSLVSRQVFFFSVQILFPLFLSLFSVFVFLIFNYLSNFPFFHNSVFLLFQFSILNFLIFSKIIIFFIFLYF